MSIGEIWLPVEGSTHIGVMVPFQDLRKARVTPGIRWIGAKRHSRRSYAVRSAVTIRTAPEKYWSQMRSSSPLVAHELTEETVITTATGDLTTNVPFTN